MQEFTLSIDPNKFRSTNSSWNNLMLNAPWSVGYVTTLIELTSFKQKEDWEDFYYQSGEQREELISGLTPEQQNILNDASLVLINKTAINQLSWDMRNLNTQYGRTKKRLQDKGLILYESVKDNGWGLTIEECIECVRFRVICETWNGVIVREKNTVEKLKQLFPQTEFRKVSGEKDHTYAVDYELYKNSVLTVAIQIKPKSYTWNAPYIQKAKNANRRKNQKYLDEFGVQVFDVIADSKGNILNSDILKKL
ncbi:MjaI family restriction endonuclease [Sinomicrobium kalidii]|uniref:MjaI family restriction endonuclease n=1 Tax=Sinomicrobium kalidii TaxID=2900738 RepID=UPI001E38D53A|nr:MjaI family restriction endonuclease [Sinomicrobium kalidii]UGU17948.1 MjaI family restriction endonuclease [Sinomicrobium kalidii]